ncbi:MAG: PilZ domain-containing protein [Candidatus Omnitrophota bacterium]
MALDNERRIYPRIADDKVSLKVGTDSFKSAISQSLNISASGVYCKVDREVPLMSRVKVILMLPVKGDDRKRQCKIETDGVVVREHPVIENGKVLHYDVAIFFDNLSSKERETIKAYVASKV